MTSTTEDLAAPAGPPGMTPRRCIVPMAASMCSR